MKRLLTLLLVTLLILCWTGIANAEATAEVLPCRYAIPGSECNDSQMVQDAINEKLKADGYNIDFQFVYIPWDVWDQKVNIMLATGEEFELLQIMEDWLPSSTYINLGGIIPLEDLLDTYAPNLRDFIEPDLWDAVSMNGHIYSVPVVYRDMSADGGQSYQMQYLEKYGLDVPTTEEEFIDVMKTILEGENDPELHAYWRLDDYKTSQCFLRSSDRWPFEVVEMLVGIDQEGNVFSWLDSPEFQHECEFVRKLYEIGYINEDVLTIPVDTRTAKKFSGEWIATETSIYAEVTNVINNKPEAVFEDHFLYPEKEKFYGTWIYMNANAVSATSKHPEAGIMFLDWLYSSQENYDLLHYGIEGRNWEAIGEDEYRALPGVDGETCDYVFGDWLAGNYHYVRCPEGTPDTYKPFINSFNTEAAYSIATGFHFDPSNVSSEYSAVLAEIQSSAIPMKAGVVSWEDGHEAMLNMVNAAGYQEVVAEFQRQFAEWLAQKQQ